MNDTDAVSEKVGDWWRTEIVDMAPGRIRFHGYAIEQLIGNVGFADMVWLMLRGELPTPGQARLLETALMAGVDHGPHAPSIAIARMAATCGVGLNNAMASAMNVLGDVHGGAGEQAMEMYLACQARLGEGVGAAEAVSAELDGFFAAGGKYVPGFGHRFHSVDPRSVRLLSILDEARADGVVGGDICEISRQILSQISARKGRDIAMNIDGATAVVYAELGFPAPLARGFFCLSRSVGILAHAWEQTGQGGRNKGPIPRDMMWTYDGVADRDLPSHEEDMT